MDNVVPVANPGVRVITSGDSETFQSVEHCIVELDAESQVLSLHLVQISARNQELFGRIDIKQLIREWRFGQATTRDDLLIRPCEGHTAFYPTSDIKDCSTLCLQSHGQRCQYRKTHDRRDGGNQVQRLGVRWNIMDTRDKTLEDDKVGGTDPLFRPKTVRDRRHWVSFSKCLDQKITIPVADIDLMSFLQHRTPNWMRVGLTTLRRTWSNGRYS